MVRDQVAELLKPWDITTSVPPLFDAVSFLSEGYLVLIVPTCSHDWEDVREIKTN